MEIPFAWLFQARGVKPGLRILGAYVAVYAILSLLGHYQDNIGSLDKLGIITRGVSDREEWQPMFIIVTRFPVQGSRSRANAPGRLFMPLVLMDQHLWHPTRPITYGKWPGIKPLPVNTGAHFSQIRPVVPPPLKRSISAKSNHILNSYAHPRSACV